LAEVISRVIQAVVGDLIPVTEYYSRWSALFFARVVSGRSVSGERKPPEVAGGWRR
jgi:hypothetical protein